MERLNCSKKNLLWLYFSNICWYEHDHSWLQLHHSLVHIHSLIVSHVPPSLTEEVIHCFCYLKQTNKYLFYSTLWVYILQNVTCSWCVTSGVSSTNNLAFSPLHWAMAQWTDSEYLVISGIFPVFYKCWSIGSYLAWWCTNFPCLVSLIVRGGWG